MPPDRRGRQGQTHGGLPPWSSPGGACLHAHRMQTLSRFSLPCACWTVKTDCPARTAYSLLRVSLKMTHHCEINWDQNFPVVRIFCPSFPSSPGKNRDKRVRHGILEECSALLYAWKDCARVVSCQMIISNNGSDNCACCCMNQYRALTSYSSSQACSSKNLPSSSAAACASSFACPLWSQAARG